MKLSKREYREFGAMVTGQQYDLDVVRPIVRDLIAENTRLREALDDIAMGGSRKTAFEALKEKLYAAADLPWLRTQQGHQGAGDKPKDKV